MSKEPNVNSFSLSDAKGVPVRFTVSTDIVDYMASARAFGREDLADPAAHGRFQKRMIAIPDRKTQVVAPMVLTIGSNNGLYLVRKREGANGEAWKLTDLAPSFQKFGVTGAQVHALGAAWTDDDRIAVAVAVGAGGSGAASRVFVAYNLSSQTDWENILWQDGGDRGGTHIHGIRVLAEADRNWTVVLDGDAGRVDKLYLLRSQGPHSFAQALVFSTAVTYQEILDFEVATDEISGSGVAVLGTSGNQRVLSFRPFPFDEQGNPVPKPVMQFPCPAGANVLESGVTRDGATDLYIGGNGIHLLTADQFYSQEDGTLREVAPPGNEKPFHEIVVADATGGAAAVWARKQDGELVVVERAAGAPLDKWSTPLQLRNGVQAIAPVQGCRLATTSLLAIYTDGRASFLMRDAGSGAWGEAPLLVANPTEAAKVTCYGTSVRLLDDGDLPRVNVKVKVSASVLTNVSLNGRNVFIGPGLEIEAKPDFNGAVLIYDRVRSLTPAVYRFQFEDMPRSIDVNPAGAIYERFGKMTAAELRKARVPKADGTEGDPLLPPEFREGGARAGEVDGMVAALQKAANLANANGKAAGAQPVQAGAAYASRLPLDQMPAGYAWGVQVTPNGLLAAGPDVIQRLAGAAATAVVDLGQFFSNLGDSLADFFEGVRNQVQKAWTFVVRKAEQAFEFICMVGDKIKKFVLKTLEQIGSFFTWLWSEVKAGVEKVWNFLKFVFDWQDILRARDVLVAVVDDAMKYMQGSSKAMREKSREGFNAAIRQVELWAGKEPAPEPEKQTVSATYGEAQPEQRAKVDQANSNSAVGWVFDHINNLLDEIVSFESPSPSATLAGAAKSFVEGMVQDQWKNLRDTADQIQRDVTKVFGGKMPGAKDLSFETVKNVLVAIGGNAAIGFLKALRDLADRALELLGNLIETMRNALYSKVRFPFIEKLVKLVSDTQIDTSFRLIDGIMLLAAVPATITYKLIFGESPVQSGFTGEFAFGSVSVQAPKKQSLTDALKPFVKLGVQVIKQILGWYAAGKAAVGDFAGSNRGIALGVIFGFVGVVASVIGVRQDEGSAVTGIDWGCVAAGSVGWMASFGFAFAMWDLPFSQAHQVEAGFNIFTTAAQIIMSAVAFAFVADSIRKATDDYNRHRVLPETFSWVASLLDSAGSLTVAASLLVPSPETKVILIGAGAIGKTAAGAFKGLEIGAAKHITEKFPKPAPA